ncbi:M56 family metallopeptidase [Paraglaciecola hydrolytica]|uniref:Peptidase M56 domain-containing protein n=1 Tax=Paraglaciecola hydrolytica TaxID=1799789 RepID=A0A148KLE3_9ALTE|nr:M56 family metallopeptidase [Paraglaciecola hydrolytica]KXI27089.1 hypothetical protein AX660_01485 [Paraglaciecola hydrolytica]
MDNLSSILDPHLIYALGWTLVHSLWQSLLVFVLLSSGLKMTNSLRPALRYRLCISALCCCVILSGLTFYQNYTQSVQTSLYLGDIQTHIALVYEGSFWSSIYQNINPWLSSVVLVWFVGFGLQFVRYLYDVLQGLQLKTQNTFTVSPEWQKRLARLLNVLQIKHSVEFKLSSKISVPCIVGHFKPVVLLPLGLFTQLPMEQVEAIVLHELAHIKRNDYLLNLVQYLVKIVFFFNPFVLLICHKIDFEREAACDDIAAKACGNALIFAKSLSRFAEFSQQRQSVLAAHKQSFFLLDRVKRIFTRTLPLSAAAERLVLLMGIAVFGLTLNVNASDQITGLVANSPTINLATMTSQNDQNTSVDIDVLGAATTSQTNVQQSIDEQLAPQPIELIENIDTKLENVALSTQSTQPNNIKPFENNTILLASAARDFALGNNPTDTILPVTPTSFTEPNQQQQAVSNTQSETTSLVKFEKPLADLSLVKINNSGFDLALFEPQFVDKQYRGIKLLPINVDKTIVESNFKRWEVITYQGLKDSLNGINQLITQHNASLGAIPDKDLLVARIEIKKVVHMKLWAGLVNDGNRRSTHSNSVEYLAGAQLQIVLNEALSKDKIGIIWAGFDVDGESLSGKNFKFWNSETQQNYWHEIMHSTLAKLDNTLEQIQGRNFVEFNPKLNNQY